MQSRIVLIEPVLVGIVVADAVPAGTVPEPDTIADPVPVPTGRPEALGDGTGGDVVVVVEDEEDPARRTRPAHEIARPLTSLRERHRGRLEVEVDAHRRPARLHAVAVGDDEDGDEALRSPGCIQGCAARSR